MPFVARGPSIVKVTNAARLDHGAIVEGRCPSCASELERRTDDGWCQTCGVGWAYRSTGPGTADVTLTIEAEIRHAS